MKMIEKRMEQRGQGGFTLIELLVVIAILAVLGGAVIIGIGAMRENAEEQVCNTNVETINLAIEAALVSDADLELADIDNDELISKELVKAATLEGWTVEAGVITADPYSDWNYDADTGKCVAAG